MSHIKIPRNKTQNTRSSKSVISVRSAMRNKSCAMPLHSAVIQAKAEIDRSRIEADIQTWQTRNPLLYNKYVEFEKRAAEMIENYFEPAVTTKVYFIFTSVTNANIRMMRTTDEDLVRLAPKQVEITIGTPLFERLTVGELLGILNHEFNVHQRADYESYGKKLTETEETEKFIPKPLAAKDGGSVDLSVAPISDPQSDHVYAAQDPKDSSRAAHYMKSTVEGTKAILFTQEPKAPAPPKAADPFDFIKTAMPAITAEPPLAKPVSQARITEAIDFICFYLFDIMRIYVENIGRAGMSPWIKYESLLDDAWKRMGRIIDECVEGRERDYPGMKKCLTTGCTFRIDRLFREYIDQKKGLAEYLTDGHTPI